MSAREKQTGTSSAAEEPERYTALYDPDTVYPARMADADTGVGSNDSESEDSGAAGPSLYAKGEKVRARTGPGEDVVKRIADRIERRAKSRKPTA